MSNFEIHEVIDEAQCCDKLSRRKLAFLEDWHEDDFNVIPQIYSWNQMNIAGGEWCRGCDLPAGSVWSEVVAATLDMIKPRDGESRLDAIQAHLEDYLGSRNDC